MSVRWKYYKTIFRYSQGLDRPIVKPQFPMCFDLTSDPHENWNLFETKMDNTWMLGPMFRAIMQCQMSVNNSRTSSQGRNSTGYK